MKKSFGVKYTQELQAGKNPVWLLNDEQFWAVGENLGATRNIGKDLF